MVVGELRVKHDELRNMIDTAVNDALKVAMTLASSTLETALKNKIPNRIDLLESRAFDVEQTIENNAKIDHDYRTETETSLTQCELN